jgi:plasmid stabilization system protein ParE
MALKIKWTKRSADKFDELLSYLEVEFGSKTTTRFARKVFDLLEIVAKYPELGQIEHQQKQIRGIKIIKHITLFYRIKSQDIILLQFFDNRQNPKSKPKK